MRLNSIEYEIDPILEDERESYGVSSNNFPKFANNKEGMF